MRLPQTLSDPMKYEIILCSPSSHCPCHARFARETSNPNSIVRSNRNRMISSTSWPAGQQESRGLEARKTRASRGRKTVHSMNQAHAPQRTTGSTSLSSTTTGRDVRPGFALQHTASKCSLHDRTASLLLSILLRNRANTLPSSRRRSRVPAPDRATSWSKFFIIFFCRPGTRDPRREWT